MDLHKPLPKRLSQWGSGTEIIYMCPVCFCDFRIYGNKELYCHECGNMIQWKNIPTHCSEEFKKQYDELVYKKYARMGKPDDKQTPDDIALTELMFKLYKGEIV